MGSNKGKLPDKFDVDLRPFKNFMDQMDTFFQHSFKQMNSFFNLRPLKVHVYETSTDVIVETELPRYKREQIDVEIIGRQLRITVKETITTEKKDDLNKYYNKDYSQQYLERYVTLPFDIPEHETKAFFKDGVLKIIVPKSNLDRKYINID